MSFDVSKFREALGGGARANLFRVTVSGITDTGGAVANTFSVTCKSASLPASTMGLIEVAFNAGRRYKLAGERTFAEWTTTVINTENFIVRGRLEDWQKGIVYTNFDSITVGNRDLYTAGEENDVANRLLRTPTILVEQLGDKGEAISKFKLHHCWPSDISTIDLSYDNADAIEEFSVTWTYDYFTQESVT
jgi:hypothetical protein